MAFLRALNDTSEWGRGPTMAAGASRNAKSRMAHVTSMNSSVWKNFGEEKGLSEVPFVMS